MPEREGSFRVGWPGALCEDELAAAFHPTGMTVDLLPDDEGVVLGDDVDAHRVGILSFTAPTLRRGLPIITTAASASFLV